MDLRPGEPLVAEKISWKFPQMPVMERKTLRPGVRFF